MKKTALILFCIPAFILAACSTANKAQQESAVGTITYGQYALRKDLPVPIDTTYYVVTNQAAFDALFLGGAGESRKPDFGGQTVVAVALPSAAELKVEKAAIAGKVMNLYIGNCSGDKNNCSRNGLLLATTPKSASVRTVHFYVNGALRRSVDVQR